MNIADQHRIAAIVRTGKAFIEACGDLEMNPEGTDVANPGCLRHVGRRVDAESRAARVVDPYEAEDAAFDAGYAKRHVERALLTLGYCGFGGYGFQTRDGRETRNRSPPARAGIAAEPRHQARPEAPGDRAA